MDVFDFRQSLVSDYEAFARSFTTIRANDLREQVNREYDRGRFWPEPLIQINPRFQPGATVRELVVDGTLHPSTARIFDLSLYRHQVNATALASNGRSYVVTTGTGSGKSLCFFLPIIDAILREKETDPCQRTRAIVIYPMNALANSQREELQKFEQLPNRTPERNPIAKGGHACANQTNLGRSARARCLAAAVCGTATRHACPLHRGTQEQPGFQGRRRFV